MLLQVKVPDRSVFETTDAETKVLSPDGLQMKIDGLLSSYKKGDSSPLLMIQTACAASDTSFLPIKESPLKAS